MNKAMIETVVC